MVLDRAVRNLERSQHQFLEGHLCWTRSGHQRTAASQNSELRFAFGAFALCGVRCPLRIVARLIRSTLAGEILSALSVP